MKYRVAFLTHQYIDLSDKPRLTYRIVNANTEQDAMDVMRSKEKVGSRYVGMVHQAEPYVQPSDEQE